MKPPVINRYSTERISYSFTLAYIIASAVCYLATNSEIIKLYLHNYLAIVSLPS